MQQHLQRAEGNEKMIMMKCCILNYLLLGSRQSQAIFGMSNAFIIKILYRFSEVKKNNVLLILKPVILIHGVCVSRFLLTCLLPLLS